MENFVSITPVNFVQIQADCHYIEPGFPQLVGKEFQSHRLPDTSTLCHEASFATIALGWNLEGLEVSASVSVPYQQAMFPNLMQGDSLELFFDTRDVKSVGFNTRFCHHFYFLPKEVEGRIAGEITRFRTEEAHELCDPMELKVFSEIKKNGYQIKIFIPSHCLFGYDPQQFDRVGFTYRMNRMKGPPQHFCIVSEDYSIEQQASLWSSLRLVP